VVYLENAVVKCPATRDRRLERRTPDRRTATRKCDERITRAGPGVSIWIRVKPLSDLGPRPWPITSISECAVCNTVLELCYVAVSEAA
jgi:hypothetical protein